MTEQELIDQLELDLLYWREVDRNQEYSDIKARVNQILARIKEALPELAKEAGYMKLAEDKSLLEIPAEEFCYYCGFPASDPVHNTVIKKYYHLFLSDRCATLYRMATGGF